MNRRAATYPFTAKGPFSVKALITRVRSLLVLLLCAAPLLIWATTPFIKGLSITVVPQLSFVKAQIQQPATSPPFTQTATSPYSKGAISYRSTKPDVATVDEKTGNVTPKKVGETRIVATQEAAAPFLAATAEYTVHLTGPATVFQPWTLPVKTYGEAASYAIGTGPSDLPPPQSNSNGAISYRLKDPAMAAIATVATQNNVTTVSILKAGDVVLVAEQAATQQFAAGSTEATLRISAVPYTVPAVTLAYGASQTLGAQVPGVVGNVTYKVVNNAMATVSGGLTINTLGVGSTTLFAVQNGVNVASGPLTVIKGTPVLSSFASMSKTVNDVPFDLAAKSNDLVTGAVRAVPVSYAVTASDNPEAVVLYGDRGQSVWIAQGGKVEITATQQADANHNAVEAKATLTTGGEALPWLKVTQSLPSQVVRDQPYTIKVLTNSPGRLPLGMISSQEPVDNYWTELPPPGSQRGPNTEDVYVVQFKNNPIDRDIPMRPILGTPDMWNVPGFPTYPFNQWPLGDTTLSRYYSDPVPFPRGEYTFTFGTTPSLVEAAIPANVILDDSSVNRAVTALEVDNPTSQNPTYYLRPVGVGTYTLKGSIDGHPTSIKVTVLPQATTLSQLNALTLTTDTKRVEVFPPKSSRTSPPDIAITYQIADPSIARLVTDAGKYYVEPVSAGNTTITATQAAAGNYATGTVSANITVNPGAPPINVFLDSITRTYGDADVLVPLPAGFNPDQVQGGNITFSASDTTSNPKGPVVSALLEGDKIRVGILHAGVTTLTARQGLNQASTTITVNKALPVLSYASAAPMQLQQLACANELSPVRMPRLNEGAELSSLSDGAITYSINSPSILSFGTGAAYDQGALRGAHPNNNTGVPGTTYSLTVQQAESADYLAAPTVTVPNALFIKGIDYIPACTV